MKGQNALSLFKKSFEKTRNPIVGTQNIKFHHQASEGETYIDVSNLTVPSGFTNPSPSELAKVRLKDFSNNLFLMSSARPGPLMEGVGLGYEIIDNNTIKLNFETYENEIFTGLVMNKTVNGVVIADVRTPGGSGALLEGQTDYSLGEAIPIVETALNQWPIQLFRGSQGRPQARNTGNAAYTGDDSIGNYQMIDRGDGYCQVIRFNIAGDVGDEPILWANNGALGERPDLSVLQNVDKIHGIMDLMREDLLAVTGYDISDPTRYSGGVPTRSDLQAFGADVAVLRKLLNAQVPIITGATPFTPTGTWTTNTTYYGHKWRIGDRLFVSGRIALSGAPNAVGLQIDIPDGLQINASKIDVGNAIISLENSNVTLLDFGTTQIIGAVIYNSPTKVTVSANGIVGGFTAVQTVDNTFPFVFTSNDTIMFSFSVPIAGWNETQSLAEQLGL